MKIIVLARWFLLGIGIGSVLFRHPQPSLPIVHAQTPTTAPDCGLQATLTASGNTSSLGNLGNVRCTTWTVSYYSEGFSAVSVSFNTAPDSGGSPGTFSAVPSGNIATGTNPLTSTSQAFLVGNIYAPWLNVSASLTGTGKIVVKIDGWRGNPH